jgi:hypothetical protein
MDHVDLWLNNLQYGKGQFENLHIATIRTIGLGLALLALSQLLLPSYNRREPPLAPSKLPVFGHMLGFMRNSFGYYEKLNKKLKLPIFTIRMPGRKIYVVTKPELITKVDKQSKAFSFAPIKSEFSSITCGTSKEAIEILNQNLLGKHRKWGLCEDMVIGMRESLRPGDNLDCMNKTMASEVCRLLEDTKPEAEKEFRIIKLSAWVAEVVTMATTNSVYGPMNPYKHRDITDAF